MDKHRYDTFAKSYPKPADGTHVRFKSSQILTRRMEDLEDFALSIRP